MNDSDVQLQMTEKILNSNREAIQMNAQLQFITNTVMKATQTPRVTTKIWQQHATIQDQPMYTGDDNRLR